MSEPRTEDWRMRLRELAGRAGSQARLAQKAGVQLRTLSLWINGPTVPPFDKAAELARVAGVSLDWLAYGTEAPPIDEDLLVEIIAAIEMEALRRDDRLPPGKYAALVAYCYLREIRRPVDDNKTVDPLEIRRAFRLVT